YSAVVLPDSPRATTITKSIMGYRGAAMSDAAVADAAADVAPEAAALPAPPVLKAITAPEPPPASGDPVTRESFAESHPAEGELIAELCAPAAFAVSLDGAARSKGAKLGDLR